MGLTKEKKINKEINSHQLCLWFCIGKWQLNFFFGDKLLFVLRKPEVHNFCDRIIIIIIMTIEN